MDALGFMWERTENFLPQQHCVQKTRFLARALITV